MECAVHRPPFLSFISNLLFIITGPNRQMPQTPYDIRKHNKVAAEWMQACRIQMLHLRLAVEAQLVACSAAIKEIKIQTGFTKTHSSGLSTQINTQPQQSVRCRPKSWVTHLNGLLMCWYGKINTGFSLFFFSFFIIICLHRSDAGELFSWLLCTLSEHSSRLNGFYFW